MPAPPANPVPARLPAWYQPAAAPFLSCFTEIAMKLVMGSTINVAATCERKSIPESNNSFLMLMLTIASERKQRTIPNKLIQYHFFNDSDRSTTGPHINLNRFAETAVATIVPTLETENPCCINKKGITTVANPWLIPDGNMMKKKLNGDM